MDYKIYNIAYSTLLRSSSHAVVAAGTPKRALDLLRDYTRDYCKENRKVKAFGEKLAASIKVHNKQCIEDTGARSNLEKVLFAI